MSKKRDITMKPEPDRLNRQESIDAVIHYKGTRLANTFAHKLHTAMMSNIPPSTAERRKSQSTSNEEALKNALVKDLSWRVKNLNNKITRMKLDVRQQFQLSDDSDEDYSNESSSSQITSRKKKTGQNEKGTHKHDHDELRKKSLKHAHAKKRSIIYRRKSVMNEEQLAALELSDGDEETENAKYEMMLRNQKSALDDASSVKQQQKHAKNERVGGSNKGKDRADALLQLLERRDKAAERQRSTNSITNEQGSSNASGVVVTACGITTAPHNGGGLSLSKRKKSLKKINTRKLHRKAEQTKATDQSHTDIKNFLQTRSNREAARRHVGRVEFESDGTPPFELPAETLLELVSTEIRWKDERERKEVQWHLESEKNQTLFECTFWYIYVVFFDPRYPDYEAMFLAAIAENYMRLLDSIGKGPENSAVSPITNCSPSETKSSPKRPSMLPHSHELFAIAHNMTRSHDRYFQLCPLVIGMGICYGLHFLCPGSRIHYYKDLKILILQEVFLLITGIQFSASALKKMLDTKNGLIKRNAVVWPERPTEKTASFSEDRILLLPSIGMERNSIQPDQDQHNQTYSNERQNDDYTFSRYNPFVGLHERVKCTREARGLSNKSPRVLPTIKKCSRIRQKDSNRELGGKTNDISNKNPSGLTLPGIRTNEMTRSQRPMEQALRRKHLAVAGNDILRRSRQEFSTARVSPVGRIYLEKRGQHHSMTKGSSVQRTVQTEYESRQTKRGATPAKRGAAAYKQYRSVKNNFKEKSSKEKVRCNTVLRQLDGLKGLVLQRGNGYLRHFSLDMVNSHDQEPGEKSPSSSFLYDDPHTTEVTALRGLRRGIASKVERLLHVGNAIGANIG